MDGSVVCRFTAFMTPSRHRRGLAFAVLFTGVLASVVTQAALPEVVVEPASAALHFAKAEILKAAASNTGTTPRRVVFHLDAALPAQTYNLQQAGAIVSVTGGSEAGAMHGGLDVAEAVRLGTLEQLKPGEHKPFIERRGLKFNSPLDLRTPSYSDSANAPQKSRCFQTLPERMELLKG
jgi:hypothetical protein